MTTASLAGFHAAALLLLVPAVVAAILARAVRGARRHGLQEVCRRRGRPEWYEQIIDASETIALVAATVVVVATVAATVVAVRSAGGPGDVKGIVSLIVWTAAVWVLLVVVPMVVTRAAGPWVVVSAWPACRPFVRLLSPMVAVIAAVSATFGGRKGAAEEAAEPPGNELKMVVDEAHREGRLEAGARAMIEGVIDLDEVRVGEIMTPRTDIVMLPVSMPWDEVVQHVSGSGHTRIPVWDRTPDDVIGILHTRELLMELAKPEGTRMLEIKPLLRPPYFVPESKTVLKLLREFQRTRTHLAVVTDEFGGVSGLVTIEDALEEIVGEIADEHDDEITDGIRMLSPGACEVRSQVRLSELNKRLGLSLPEEADFETVGGLVFHQAGRIPQPGEMVEVDGVALEVLSATRSRIDWIRVEKRRGPEPAP